MNFVTDLLKKTVVLVVLAFFVGLGLGIFYAWQIDPVKWVDAPVSLLRDDLRHDYMRMALDSYRVNRDDNQAIDRYKSLGADAKKIFEYVKSNPGNVDPRVIELYEQVLRDAGVYNKPTAGESPSATPSGGTTSALIWGAVLALLVVVAAFAFYLLRGRRSGPLTPAQQATETNKNLERTDFSAVNQAPPVAQYVTTYVIGDDLFDDSFSIDSPAGEFLGECGVGIAETVGVGDPKKVTAFEVWMFDKNDIQTITKVLMTPYAFNDMGLRGKLESKGELVMLEPRKQVVLETQTLQMVASVADISYGQGPMPERSHIERVTLELAIWPK